MKPNAIGKSSFTLAAKEHAQVRRLRRLLKARSNTEVIRRSLRLLEESVSREELRRQFREASARVRSSTLEAVHERDPLARAGLQGAGPDTPPGGTVGRPPAPAARQVRR